MSEKFNLRWNDFQSKVSNSFGVLREEKDFLDVTLVSDDGTEMSGHKVVLSASSGLFKSLLRNISHSHPLLYLSGIQSSHLTLILDYIYHGEVQVCRDDLDSFLEVAHKLKIGGLIKSPSKTSDLKSEDVFNDDLNESKDDIDIVDTETDHEEKTSMKTRQRERIIAVTLEDNSQAEEKIEGLISRDDGVSLCRVCGYRSNRNRDVRRHVEIHIEGLSYPCSVCEKTFKTTKSLLRHRSKYHK